jgi:hypothetical protein
MCLSAKDGPIITIILMYKPNPIGQLERVHQVVLKTYKSRCEICLLTELSLAH